MKNVKTLILVLTILTLVMPSAFAWKLPSSYEGGQQESEDLSTARQLDSEEGGSHYERSERIFASEHDNPNSELRHLPSDSGIADDIHSIRDRENGDDE